MSDVDVLIGLIMVTDTLWALVGIGVIMALIVAVIMWLCEPNLERAFRNVRYGKCHSVGDVK